MCVHKLKTKVVFFNQIKVLENKVKKFLSFGLFLLKYKQITVKLNFTKSCIFNTINNYGYHFDEPHNAFEVHFLMKTQHVSNETSSILSCTMRNKEETPISDHLKCQV